MFGTPGAVVGGVLGGAYGALKGPLADKKAVELYDKQVDAYLAARKELPKGMRGDAKKAALAIHNNDAIPLTQEPAALAALVQQMGAATQQKKALGGGDLTKRALQVQLEMTNMMNNIGNQAVGSGDAMAASIRAGIPNASPELQPLLERDAADRAAFGRTLQTAYTGATYAQPQIAKMDAQLALLRQLQQQMAAQSSSTIAGQLAALK
jgi:hypothetical protein